MERHIAIDDFDYDLPEARIAKFPLPERSASKLLVYDCLLYTSPSPRDA